MREVVTRLGFESPGNAFPRRRFVGIGQNEDCRRTSALELLDNGLDVSQTCPDQDQTLGFETERSIPRPLLFCGKPGSAGRTTPNHALPSGAVEQLVRFDGFGLIGTVKGKNSPQWLGVHRGPALHRARPRTRRVSRPSRKSSANVSPTQAGTDAGLATVITVPSMVISANTII